MRIELLYFPNSGKVEYFHAHFIQEKMGIFLDDLFMDSTGTFSLFHFSSMESLL